jgi:hypothetical protein
MVSKQMVKEIKNKNKKGNNDCQPIEKALRIKISFKRKSICIKRKFYVFCFLCNHTKKWGLIGDYMGTNSKIPLLNKKNIGIFNTNKKLKASNQDYFKTTDNIGATSQIRTGDPRITRDVALYLVFVFLIIYTY